MNTQDRVENLTNLTKPIERENGDVQFMLTEFSELGEFFRHTDTRVYTTANLYLTFAAAIITVLVLLVGYVVDMHLYGLVALPLQGALLILGYFLAEQLVSADFTKREYLLGLNLIRQYFVDEYPQIAPYVLLPRVSPAGDKAKKLIKVVPRSSGQLVVFVQGVNSALLGTMGATIFWLATSSVTWSALGAVGLGITVALLALWFFRRRYEHYLNWWFETHIK